MGDNNSDDGLRDLVLNGEDVAKRAIEPFRPLPDAGLRIDQLGRDPDPFAHPAYAAFDDVADAKLFARLAYVDSAALVAERRVARDHRQVGEVREPVDDVFGDPVAEYSWPGSPLRFANGRTATDGPSNIWRADAASCSAFCWRVADSRAEQIAALWDGLDDALRRVAQSVAHLADTLRQRLVGHRQARPYRGKHLLSRNQASCVLDEEIAGPRRFSDEA